MLFVIIVVILSHELESKPLATFPTILCEGCLSHTCNLVSLIVIFSCLANKSALSCLTSYSKLILICSINGVTGYSTVTVHAFKLSLIVGSLDVCTTTSFALVTTLFILIHHGLIVFI